MITLQWSVIYWAFNGDVMKRDLLWMITLNSTESKVHTFENKQFF